MSRSMGSRRAAVGASCSDDALSISRVGWAPCDRPKGLQIRISGGLLDDGTWAVERKRWWFFLQEIRTHSRRLRPQNTLKPPKSLRIPGCQIVVGASSQRAILPLWAVFRPITRGYGQIFQLLAIFLLWKMCHNWKVVSCFQI